MTPTAVKTAKKCNSENSADAKRCDHNSIDHLPRMKLIRRGSRFWMDDSLNEADPTRQTIRVKSKTNNSTSHFPLPLAIVLQNQQLRRSSFFRATWVMLKRCQQPLDQRITPTTPHVEMFHKSAFLSGQAQHHSVCLLQRPTC